MQGHWGEGIGPLAAVMAMGFGVAVLAILASLAVGVAICWFLMTCFQRVPPAYRKQEPGLVWLLLIPCFNIVWNFFVLPRLADSYKAYFDSVARTDVGDCGRSLALGCCILPIVNIVISWLGWVPVIGRLFGVLGCLVGLANLILLIAFLVKAASLKAQIRPQVA